MAEDLFEQMLVKQPSVLKFMKSKYLQLQRLNLQDNKLIIQAPPRSHQDLKKKASDQIRLADPSCADPIAAIQAPAAAACGSGTAACACTVLPGDTLFFRMASTRLGQFME